uniref:Uncharacterized protein n=1 Tax=Acrobeloides nanus TaxID=290746 RepID=A0A914C9K4_9BILA
MKLFTALLFSLFILSYAQDDSNIEQEAARVVSSGAHNAADTITNIRHGIRQKAAEYREALSEIPEKIGGAVVAAKDKVGEAVISAGESITSDQALKERQQKEQQHGAPQQ